MQVAGIRLEQVRGFSCDIRAGHLHRICGAALRLCCEPCWGAVVQDCEQRITGRWQSATNGKVLSCAGEQVEFRKNWSSVSCRKIEVQLFLEKLDSNFSAIPVSHLLKRGSDMLRGFCSMRTWQREK